jgi:hypothetical protein
MKPGTYPKTMATRLRTAGATRLLPLLLLLVLPTTAHPQFTYITNNGAIAITGYYGPGGDLAIPSAIDGLPVTFIWDDAFYECYGLTSVTIPNTVIAIGDFVFSHCYGLARVTIPNSVIDIGIGAFFGCHSLTSVTIPNSVLYLDMGAFAGCSGLTSVAIPNSVTWIESHTFDGCCGLTNIVMPNSVTHIYEHAFRLCTNLTSVTIPNSATYIDDYAFESCYNLTGVYFQGNAPTAYGAVFYGDDNAIVYYLPRTTGWEPTFGGRPTALWNPLIQVSSPGFGERRRQLAFTIAGTTNIPIAIEACTNLASSSWILLQTCTLTNGSICFCDPGWTNYQARIYRLRSP